MAPEPRGGRRAVSYKPLPKWFFSANYQGPKLLMKTIIRFLALASLSLALVGAARAADIDGKWQAEFDGQIGHQKYVFDLKADGEKLTGKASFERQDQKGEVAIAEGKLAKDAVSFVEVLKFQDQEVRIEYTGKIAGDELKLHRKVGEFAEYDIVAKRVGEKK